MQEDYRNSYFDKYLLRLLLVSRKQDIDQQNLLSHELDPVPLDLFYVNGAVRHTAKSTLSNEIQMENPDHGETN